MFHTMRHHDELPFLDPHVHIVELHSKSPFHDEEHLVFVVVVMPDELTLELIQLHKLSIELSDNKWLPVFSYLLELLLDVHFLHRSFLLLTVNRGNRFKSSPYAIHLEMPRPLESLFTLPRVRLVHRVPILETERLIERLGDHARYRARLARNALQVSEGSAQQFHRDDQGLLTLLQEIHSADYIVTKRSKEIMERMLKGIYGDGLIFKEFEQRIEPLYDVSRDLQRVSKFADSLADKTKEESLDVARALLIQLPKPTSGE